MQFLWYTMNFVMDEIFLLNETVFATFGVWVFDNTKGSFNQFLFYLKTNKEAFVDLLLQVRRYIHLAALSGNVTEISQW